MRSHDGNRPDPSFDAAHPERAARAARAGERPAPDWWLRIAVGALLAGGAWWAQRASELLDRQREQLAALTADLMSTKAQLADVSARVDRLLDRR